MEDFSLNHGKAPEKLAPEALLNDLFKLNEDQLMDLRHAIDMKLNISIGQLNLIEELGLQYRQGKMMLKKATDSTSMEPHQQAQIFNSTSAQLEKIVKMRGEIYSQERLKRFEGAVLKILKMMKDDKLQKEFFDLYGEFLQDKGK